MAAIGDSFFLFEIQKLKRALRKLDDKEVISTKIISEIIESSALKLEKGGYEGTAEDLRILADAVNTGFTGVSITPTSSPTGTGIASWVALQAGTYTNFGGVVVAANSMAIISRNAAGAFSISQTALDLTAYSTVIKSLDFQYITRITNSDEIISGGTVIWSDGSNGVVTNTDYNTDLYCYDGFIVTHISSGKTITQPKVTRNYLGVITIQPQLIIS